VTYAVIPFKNLEDAKERLSSRLDQHQRRALVLAMLEDVLGAVSRVAALEGVIVVTREPEVIDRAARFGAEILEEPANDGHTAAVHRAVRELERRHATAMLCVSGDLPAITSAEIAALLCALGPPPSVVLAPSRDDRGTNAVVVSPPGALPLRFGEPSFPAHLARACELGLRTEVMRLWGTALDLDTPGDLDFFVRTPSETATYRWLRGQHDR
jgi:2-phospho-L-lactate guanylyltransferase